MVENENEAVRDRLGDLERKVHMQNDEIVCLKATLADCLRRLNTLEVDKVRWGNLFCNFAIKIKTFTIRTMLRSAPHPLGM